MGVTAVVGAQWGDEGKGKLVHLLSQHQDFVLRYQGGSNAGHTVAVNGEVYKFKLVPSGILHQGVQCLLCDGVVVNPLTLREEITELSSRGALRGQLHVSSHAHLVLPYHAIQDTYFEESKGKEAIGTTRRGIGPAYADKHFRVGFRAGDVLRPGFAERVKSAARRKNVLFAGYYQREECDPDKIWDEVAPAIETLAPLVTDTIQLTRQALADKARIMCEGAQGTLLDIDYGTYPFVTSSHPSVGGALLGTGLSWREIDKALGVTKAYTTRVGAGPFPTEEVGEAGERMRQAGAEYGTVTGRPRRCGWLDLPLLNYTTQLNGFTELALTKTDVLDTFDEIKVCVAYEIGGKRITWPDLDPAVMQQCTPVYETLPGWGCPTCDIRHWADLPAKFKDYIAFVEAYVKTPVTMISVGPDWEATITR